MKRILAGAAAAVTLALSVSGASAAPFSGVGKATLGADAGIIKVHGVHRECVEGRMGWHRSTPWGGRIACRPMWNKWRGGHHGHHDGRGYEGRDRGHDDRAVRTAPRRPVDVTPQHVEPRRYPRGSH